MRKSTINTVTTCIGIAAAAGTAYMLTTGSGSDARRRSKRIRRNTGRTLRQVGNFIEHTADMIMR